MASRSGGILLPPSIADTGTFTMKSSYAKIVNKTDANAASEKRASTTECKPDQLKTKPDDVMKSYLIRSLPPDGFNDFIEEKFKSINYNVINKIKINGQFRMVLKLGFNSAMDSYASDIKEADKFSIKIGRRSVEYVALSGDQVDKAGTHRPRLAKNLKIFKLPLELAQNPEYIRKALEKFVQFEDDIKVVMLREGENQIFRGTVVIPVKSFLAVPADPGLLIDFPYLIQKEDGSFEVDEMGLHCLKIQCIGFDAEKVTKVHRDPIICRYCKNEGHMQRNCLQKARDDRELRLLQEDKKKSNSRCNRCYSTEFNCTRSKCKNPEIQKDRFLSAQEKKQLELLHIEEEKQKIAEQEGDWIPVTKKTRRKKKAVHYEESTRHSDEESKSRYEKVSGRRRRKNSASSVASAASNGGNFYAFQGAFPGLPDLTSGSNLVLNKQLEKQLTKEKEDLQNRIKQKEEKKRTKDPEMDEDFSDDELQ